MERVGPGRPHQRCRRRPQTGGGQQEYEGGDGGLKDDPSALQRLKEAAEKAKIELSGRLSTNINLPYIAADDKGPQHLDVTLTRAKFEQLCDDLFQRTMPPMKKALADAGIDPSSIDEVILVGGSTRIPRSRRSFRSSSARSPTRA